MSATLALTVTAPRSFVASMYLGDIIYPFQVVFRGHPLDGAIVSKALMDAALGNSLDYSSLDRVGVTDFEIFFQIYAWFGHIDAFIAYAHELSMSKEAYNGIAKWCDGYAHIDARLKHAREFEFTHCDSQLSNDVTYMVTLSMYLNRIDAKVRCTIGRAASVDALTIIAQKCKDAEYGRMDHTCIISACRCAFEGALEGLKLHKQQTFTPMTLAAAVAGGSDACAAYVREMMLKE